MQNPILILSILLALICGLTPSNFVRSQCLSPNDNLAFAIDTDLSVIQDFNIDLFQRVIPRSPLENIVLSPYSVWNALIISYFGTAGETQRQFEKVLRVQDKLSTLRKWRQLEYLYLMRPETSVNNTFIVANRAYFDTTVAIRFCMEDILHNEIRKLDFFTDSQGSAEAINSFVRETTLGHIDRLVAPLDVMFAHMVLVNAAYFKGIWASTFDPKDTKVQPFTTLTNQQIDVDMMSQFGRFKYAYNDTMQAEILELPYMGDVVSMYLLLPYQNDEQTFMHMVDTLSYAQIERIIEDMFETQMHVFLPKFTLETVVEDELTQALYDMGLKDAFVAGKANFTDFSFNPNIKLDHGIHKAFIEVNEKGTEAAAATAFIANKIGGSSNFNCNRPFIFFIRDNDTANLMFVGAVKNPPSVSQSAAFSPTTAATEEQKRQSLGFGVKG